MLNKVKTFAKKKQEGATAIEYALIVVVIALVMYLAAGKVGTALSTQFGTVASDVAG